MKKSLAVIIISLLCLSLMIPFAACGENVKEPQVEPPVRQGEVTDVTIRYNEKDVAGIINVDLSEKVLKLSARVDKTGDDVDGTVTFESEKEEVAVVSNDGTVTLVAEGETVITASAGNKTHSIVLAVSDSFAVSTYTITVVDGVSDVATARPGDPVTLTVVPPEHKTFVKWAFSINGKPAENIWQNGNVFSMPEGDVTVAAEFTDTFYTLNVIGGYVFEEEGETFEGEAEDGGNYINGNLPEYDIAVYHFIYETQVTLKPLEEEPAGKMFVGWDYASENNRVGAPGEGTHTLTMPDETLTVWAVYSETSPVYNSASNIVQCDDYKNAGSGAIVEGKAPGETSADPDLLGMNGYRFSIKGNCGPDNGISGNSLNIQPTNICTMLTGSQTIRLVLKNHNDKLSVTVEFFAEFYSNMISSGLLTIGPNETVVKYFTVPLGFNNTHAGLRLRQAIDGGTEEDLILLDMAMEKADTYPKGDPLLFGTGGAQWVSLGDWGRQGSSWNGGQSAVFHETETTLFAISGPQIPDGNYIAAKINNMPAYDPSSPATTVYIRLINNVAEAARVEIGIGTNERHDQDEGYISQVIELDAHGVSTIKLEIPRNAGDDNTFYCTFISRGGRRIIQCLLTTGL